MSKTVLAMIGGFLGAGKTTAILQLAQFIARKGQQAAVITNDQSVELVDTARVRAAGVLVREITGGCFCCKFDALIEAASDLSVPPVPDVIIAEPVGSCTDLAATVSYPLRQFHGARYRVAPLSVMVDPFRLAELLGDGGSASLSDKVQYVARKQLEEAELIVINKVELLSHDDRKQLVEQTSRAFQHSRVLEVSCVTGEGLEPWFDEILRGTLGVRPAMEVDYDLYAEGEALLGWLNASAAIAFDHATDGDRFLLDFAERVQGRMQADAREIAHLKVTLREPASASLGAVSLTRSGGTPDSTRKLASSISDGVLTVNLRAEAAPAELERAVRDTLHETPGAATLHTLSAFRPGRPVPTHRLTSGVMASPQ